MTDAEIRTLIEDAADRAAAKTLKKLKEAGRVTYVFRTSFKKTEELLYLYPKLPEGHPERARIEKALEKIKDDDCCDVIASRYFDGLTITAVIILDLLQSLFNPCPFRMSFRKLWI